MLEVQPANLEQSKLLFIDKNLLGSCSCVHLAF